MRPRRCHNVELDTRCVELWIGLRLLEDEIRTSWKVELGHPKKRGLAEMEVLYGLYNFQANLYTLFAEALCRSREACEEAIWFPKTLDLAGVTWRLVSRSSRGGFLETEMTPIRYDALFPCRGDVDHGVRFVPPLCDYIEEERECDSPCLDLFGDVTDTATTPDDTAAPEP